MIYFISDLHFNHDREFICGPRGYKSCKEMNEDLLKKWIKTVGSNDDIYVVGDFFLGPDNDFVKRTLATLPGRIHVIIGNHDTPAKVAIYKQAKNVVEVAWATQIEYRNRKLYINHYPTETASLESNPKFAVINVSGHTHKTEKFHEGKPFKYNVAVDAHNGYPVSIDQLIDDVEKEIKECFKYLV